jgi:predicted phage-related endonuclease
MGLTTRQLEIRRSGITATDVRVLSGLDPFGRTPHDIFASKVLGIENFEETEAIELGMALEPIVIPRLAKKLDLHVLRIDPDLMTIRHKSRETHIATPDAFFAETAFHAPKATGQVKVCGLHNAPFWGGPGDGIDGVPEAVVVQCAWEVYVAGVDVCHVGALLGTEIRPYTIERDASLEDLISALRQVADQFWTDHVLPKVPPTLDGSEGATRMLKALFPKARAKMVKATPEAEQAAEMYFAATGESAAAKERKDLAAQLLIAACGEAEGIAGEGWRLLYGPRKAYTVAAHEVPEGRRFDCRKAGVKGRAAGAAKKSEAA